MRVLFASLLLCGVTTLQVWSQEPEEFEIKLGRRQGQTAIVDIDIKIDGELKTTGRFGKKSRYRKRVDIRLADSIDLVEEEESTKIWLRRRYVDFKREEEGLKTDPEQAGALFLITLDDKGPHYTDKPQSRHSSDCLALELNRAASLGFTIPFAGKAKIGDEIDLDMKALLSLLLGIDSQVVVKDSKLRVTAGDAEEKSFGIAGTLKLEHHEVFGIRELDWIWDLNIELTGSSELGQFTSIKVDGKGSASGAGALGQFKAEVDLDSKATLRGDAYFDKELQKNHHERWVTRAVKNTPYFVDLPSSWHELPFTITEGLAYANVRNAEGDSCRILFGDDIYIVPISPEALGLLIPGFESADVRDFKTVHSGLGTGITNASPEPPYVFGDLYLTKKGALTVGMKAENDSAKKARKFVRKIRNTLRLDP